MACRELAQADNELEDAARYRWLRDQAHPDSEDSGIAVSESDFNDWGNKFTRYYSGEELDAAIDAARAADSGVQEDAARESEYRRGYRHGYEQRDAEVRKQDTELIRQMLDALELPGTKNHQMLLQCAAAERAARAWLGSKP